MKTLKKTKDERDLIVLAEKNTLKVLTDIDKYGASGVVECSRSGNSRGESIMDFCSVGENEIIALWRRGLITVFQYDFSSSRVVKEIDLFLETGIPGNAFISNAITACSKGRNIVISVSDMRSKAKAALIWLVKDYSSGQIFVQGKEDFNSREKKPGSLINDLNCEYDVNGDPVLFVKEQAGDRALKAYILQNRNFELLKNLKWFTKEHSYGLQYKDGNIFTVDISGRIYSIPLEEERRNQREGGLNRSKSSIMNGSSRNYGYEKPTIISNINNAVTPEIQESRSINRNNYNSRSRSPIGRDNRSSYHEFNPYQRARENPKQQQISRTPPPYRSHYDSMATQSNYSQNQRREYTPPPQRRNDSLMNKVVTFTNEKRPQNANIDRRYNEPTFRKERVEQLNNVSALDYMTEKQRTSNLYTPNKGPNLMRRDSGRDSGYKSFIKPIPINNDINPVSDSVYPFDQNNTNSRHETPYINSTNLFTTVKKSPYDQDPDDYSNSRYFGNSNQRDSNLNRNTSAFDLSPLPPVNEMSTSELSQSQSPKRSQQVSGQVMEEYTNPYLPQSKYNGNMEISDNFGGNTGNKNNDNKNNVNVSNFDNSVVPLSESKSVNNRGDLSKAHKSFNNTKGTTVDKDGKVRDHSNLIQSMNNYTTIQTDFKLCLCVVPYNQFSGFVGLENEKYSLMKFKINNEYNKVDPKPAKSNGSYYDGAYLPGKKRLFFSETRKGIIYELTTQNLVRAAKAKGSSLPSKIVRFSKKEDCLIVNEDNILKVFQLQETGLMDTGISIDFAKTNNLSIEDFTCVGSNKIIVGHTNGHVAIVAYDYFNTNWLKLYEINLNDGKKQEEKMNISCLATDSRGGFLAIATTDANYPNENILRQIIVFRVTKKYNMELYATRDFSLSSDPGSYYPYLCFDFVSSRLPVVLAFQGGARFNLDAYILTKHNTLELLHSVENYHQGDFSAIRSVDGNVFSVDFDGNMNILNVGT